MKKSNIIKYQNGKPVSKKVLVVAESPMHETTTFLPRYFNSNHVEEPNVISNKSGLPVPERMQTLWRHIVNAQQLAANTQNKQWSDIDKITWSLNQAYDKKTEKAQIEKESTAIRNPLFPIDDKKFKVVTESDRIAYMASNARYSRLGTTTDKLREKFNQNNPVIETRDDTFVKEANNVKTFYKKTDPSVDVEVLPLYENKELLKKKLSELTPNDKFLLFGHSGDKLAGISNDTIAKYLQNCSVEDIYLGTCYADKIINPYQNLKGKTINYRPDTDWLGFNPNATNLDEAMWSRREYIDNNDNYEHTVGPLIPGVTHKQVKLRKGGIIKAQSGGIIKYQKGAKTYYTDEEIAKMNNNQSQKRNIHTNKSVITPYQEWVKQNAYQSPIAKQIKEASQRQREQSEVYTEPNGKITVYSKGIQPTASPIDFAVGGIGALYGGGLKLAGTQLDLVNPIPMPNVSKLIRKIDDYLPTTVDKAVKPRYKINLTPDGFYEGQFLNQKEYLGEGLENLVYKSNDNKNAFKLRHVMQPTKDISNIKLRSRLLEELSGQRTPTVGYFKIEGIKPSMPIIQQPYIPHHGGPITEQEIQAFVTKHKMQKLNNWKHPSYKYKNYVLDDLHEENFVRDKEGNIRLIDLFAKKLKEHRPPIDHDEF